MEGRGMRGYRGRERGSEEEKEERWRQIHLEIVSASVWPLAYWNLTYLQMFSLAEIHGRLHRPEAEKGLSTYSLDL